MVAKSDDTLPMAPVITDWETLEKWLEGQPREVAVAIAARAALRVLPLLATDRRIENGGRQLRKAAAVLVSPVFWCMALPWVAASYPTHGRDLAAAAAAAAARAAARAAAADARAAAADAAADAARAAAAADARAAYAAAAAAAADAADADADAIWNAITADAARVEIAADQSGMTVAGAALWPDGAPGWAQDNWTLLRDRLHSLDEHWRVWTDWYERRLGGQNRGEKIELLFATIPYELDGEGPTAINAEIARRIAEIAAEDGTGEDGSDWAERRRDLPQDARGAEFVEVDDRLALSFAAEPSDRATADQAITGQLHDAIGRKAGPFAETAKRLDNRYGWQGVGAIAERFDGLVDCATSAIPDRIAAIWETTVELGSYLELDNQARSNPEGGIDALDDDVRRQFADLIKNAAPFVRRFESARRLDEETGAFLTRPELFEPVETIFETAQSKLVISPEDAAALLALVAAAKRGDFQGQKAGARGLFSARNLIVACMTGMVGFYSGATGSYVSDKLDFIERLGDFVIDGHEAVFELANDMPDDIRHAIRELIADLRKRRRKDQKIPAPAVLPGQSGPRRDRRNDE